MNSIKSRLPMFKWKLIAITILLVVSFFSCQTVEKATDYLKKKNALAGVCADNFPVDTTIREVTDTLRTIDVSEIPIVISDTVIENDTVRIRIHTYTTTTKWITTTRTITSRDRAAEAALQVQLDEKKKEIIVLQTSRDLYKDQRDAWIKNFFWAIGGVLVMLIILLRKPLGSLVIKAGSLISKIRNPFK